MSEMVAKPSAHAERTVSFLQPNGSEVPFRVFSSQEVYDREQERIFRGATWSFLGLEAEIPNVYDFKSTFIGDTPVVVRSEEHTSELQSLMRISYAVFCLKKQR